MRIWDQLFNLMASGKEQPSGNKVNLLKTWFVRWYTNKDTLKHIWWSACLDIFSGCAVLCIEFKAAEADNEPLRYEQILAPSSGEWTQICFLWVWRKEIRMFSQRVFFSQVCHEGLLKGKMNQTDYFDRIWNDWMTSFEWLRKLSGHV